MGGGRRTTGRAGPHRVGRAPVLCAVWAALLGAVPSAAQEPDDPDRAAQVGRIEDHTIDLDGRLTEQAWHDAAVLTGFTQREPNDGSPATERTEVRVLYSSGAIYVGVWAFDSDPQAIRGELGRRDSRTRSDEIAIYIDSYHDHRTCFEFAVTPRGSIRDAYLFNDSPHSRDDSWDPVWEVKTAVDPLGWTAEFRIPFSQLRFDPDETVWGFQVSRRIERKAEEDWWAPWSQTASGFVSLFGDLEGLASLSPSMRLEVLPYTVASTRARPEADGALYAPSHETDLKVGFDAKYGISSDFTLDLTVNPDFGQVEADPAVVNLSAFETFFPEKRGFFVEGSGLFDQWVSAGDLFYSRRIGRRPQGWAEPPDGGTVEIPDHSTIIGAAKITGKTSGGLGIGILSALNASEGATLRNSDGLVTGTETVGPLTHYFAGRVEQDLGGGNHTVGSMVTAVNRKLNDNSDFLHSQAYAGEIDGRHRWGQNTYMIRWQIAGSHVRGSQNALLRTQRSPFRYYQRPDADHVAIDSTRTSLTGYSFRLAGGKVAGTWQYQVQYSRVSPGFHVHDLGFQWTADRQELRADVTYLSAQPRGIFRNFRVSLDAERSWTTGGELLNTWLRPLHVRGTLRNNWSFYLNPLAVGLDQLSVTALRGGPALKSNTWRNTFGGFETDERKRASLGVNWWVGGQFGSDSRWYGAGPYLRVRPSGLVNLSLALSYSWERNPEQWVTNASALDSTRHVLAEIEQNSLRLTFRANWTVNPTLSVQLYAQPFVSTGAYRKYKEVVAPRATAFDDRFKVYGDELECIDGACEVDVDLDGTADFTLGQPDFSFRSLRSTFVVRWEYRPGSVLFFAWQHGRSDSVSDPTFRWFRDLGKVFDADSDNTFLVKANYWISF